MAVIQPDEIATLLRRALTPQESAMLELLIDGIEGEAQTIIGAPVTVQEYTETVYASDLDPVVYLTHKPVRSIVSTTVDGMSVSPLEFAVQPYGFEWYDYNFASGGAPVWPYPGGAYVVTYTAGLDLANDTRYRAVKNTIQRAVVREFLAYLDGTPGYSNTSEEGFSGTREKNEYGSFTAAEAKMLADHGSKVQTA
jgi:hypothetical protein